LPRTVKSDPADAHLLADMVRTDHHQLRVVAGDSELAGAVKALTRAHKTLIWERTRHTLRLRSTLREYFPAALVAFEDLTAADTLELLGKATDPASAARLTITQITAALKRAHRHHRDRRAGEIQAALRTPQLGQAPLVAGAYAVAVRAQVAILGVLNEQIALVQEQVEAHFGQHPDAEIYTSQPGLQRDRGLGHRAALRQLANRPVGVLHGCLKTGTSYDETTAWSHHTQEDQLTAA
jgi:transposase